jgi:hypothetical protein
VASSVFFYFRLQIVAGLAFTATVEELTKELERYRLPNKQVDNALSVMPEIH